MEGECLRSYIANSDGEYLSFDDIPKVKMSPLAWRLGKFVGEDGVDYAMENFL